MKKYIGTCISFLIKIVVIVNLKNVVVQGFYTYNSIFNPGS